MEHLDKQKAKFFLTSIYKKAWKDKVFLKNLVKNPIDTLNKFTGKIGVLPDGTSLVVEDQTNPNHVYLNIPAKPENYCNKELNDNHLDKVTGGFFNSINMASFYMIHFLGHKLNL